MLLLFWNGSGSTPPTGMVHILPMIGTLRLSLGSVCILPIYGGLQL